MPWHIVSEHSECPSSRPWAVVKDADGSVVGCHETESSAQDQLAALNIAESEENSMSTATKNKAPDIERRAFALENVEIRAESNDDGSISMTGYASVFNRRSVVMWDPFAGSFVEEVEPGAFSKTLGEADVRLLINHDPNLILARTRSDTLQLTEDDIGLRVEARMAPTSYANDLAISMRRGDISQMSFAFRTIKDSWGETEDGMPLRHLHEVALNDASVVTYPAYPDAAASVRSIEWNALMDAIGLADVEDDERHAFVNELIHQEITPERLPVLQAAREALEARIAAAQPHEKHSAVSDRERRYRALATMYGLENRLERQENADETGAGTPREAELLVGSDDRAHGTGT